MRANSSGRRDEKQQAADEAADQADRGKRRNIDAMILGRRPDPVARGKAGRDLAGKQSDRARRIGRDRRHARGDQRGQGQKRAPAGQSIDDARRKGGERHERDRNRHKEPFPAGRAAAPNPIHIAGLTGKGGFFWGRRRERRFAASGGEGLAATAIVKSGLARSGRCEIRGRLRNWGPRIARTRPPFPQRVVF